MNSMTLCGWDGGGTKTRVRIADVDLTPIAERDFGPLNINGNDAGALPSTVLEIVSFMAEYSGGLANCRALVIGTAGVSNRIMREVLHDTLKDAGWRRPWQLTGDHAITLAGANRGCGAVLIAGTGSILYGNRPDGATYRVGGYGHLIDDEGSGYAIGRDILRAAVRAGDGRGECTCLTGLVEETIGTKDIVTWLYAPTTGKREVASLFPLLGRALMQGDTAAEHIAETAANALTELVDAGRVEGELSLSGGALSPESPIRTMAIQRIKARHPALHIHDPIATPVQGAVILARRIMREEYI